MQLPGAALVMMTSAARTYSAMAQDADAKGVQKLTMHGSDDCWHCLAREYSRDSNQAAGEVRSGEWRVANRGGYRLAAIRH
ncbi:MULTISPECIES: hypothetical protein [unclassified Bradyrhizobium]